MLRLKIGYEQAKVYQEFENLAIIASKVFGKKDKTSDVPVPKNENELRVAMSQVFGTR